MNEAHRILGEFAAAFADRNRDLASLQGPVFHYGLFVRGILSSRNPNFVEQRNINDPTSISSGDAITPWHAAACMEDRLRTAAFIRGAIRGVEQALKQFTCRPLHLLEAGCGPLGTLILPLLSHFSADELAVSLIDVHQESIECVEAILDHFQFLPRVRTLIVADATSVTLDEPIQVILTETMNTALSAEPQVEITRSLLKRHRDALLIPQSIRVELMLLDLAAEWGQFPPLVSNRTNLGMVFELNRRTALELEEEDGLLPAAAIRLPSSIDPQRIPCLTTTIQVFEDVQTGDYETQISCPVPMCRDGLPQLTPGDLIQFQYRMGANPGLIWHIVDAERFEAEKERGAQDFLNHSIRSRSDREIQQTMATDQPSDERDTLTALPDRIRLDRRYDVEPLQKEVREIVASLTQQFYVYYSAVRLAGHVAIPQSHPWHSEPMLNECPFLQAAFAAFETEIKSIRLMRLEPGADLKEHTDPRLDAVHREVIRLTLPVFSDDRVEFLLNGSEVPMKPGELWYMKLSNPHSVHNRSPHERINMSIDLVWNPWLETWLTSNAHDTTC